ncbi:MAG: hypothetical protein F2825_09390 [Actinobacteria bacterium]|uniref:Unannotated protein n=1 Tax=freshwater metagenome TaxID=449393 RepID=A0A6J7IB61_9ZZZZ|nr:hypothetical protein [Actinomycetota bacterium]
MSHRPARLLLAAAASALLLAGCGGGVDEEVGAASSSAAGQSEGGATEDGEAGAPDVEYDTVAVPEEFGGGDIPVPPGLTPGEPVVTGGEWEIEIDGIDKEEGVAFYGQALPAAGFTVEVENELLVTASDDTRTVTATLSPGPDGVSVTVAPVS